MNPWRFNETYSLVKAVYGREQETLVRASTRSVQDRKDFAAYHFHEALRLHKQFEKKHLSDRMLIEIYTQDGIKARQAFEIFMVRSGAHALAAIQSIHAIPDILAHAIYFATGHKLNQTKSRDQQVDLQKVVTALKQSRQHRNLRDS